MTGSASRVRFYRGAVRRRARRRLLLEAVSDGLWLGVMDAAHLRRLDQDFFSTTSEPVDGVARTYSDREHIESGLTDWEKEAVSGFRAGGDVLVTAAGAGREVVGLTALGFQVWGFEPNADLVAAGRAVLPDPARLRPCAYDEFPPFEGRLDGVVVGWGSYMLLQSRSTRLRLLEQAHAALRPGGGLLLSYFDRPATRYFGVVRAVGTPLRRLRGRPPLELGDALSPNFNHYFSPAEVRAEVEDAGFEVLRQARTPYGHTVARRPGV